MTDDEKVNAVAGTMQLFMGSIDSAYSELVGAGQHELILLVGAGNVVQYVSNTNRQRGVLMLQDLLARWSLGFPDRMPGEQTPGDVRPFEYLLNKFESAAQADKPAEHDYAARRTELLNYVGGLVAENNRLKASRG